MVQSYKSGRVFQIWLELKFVKIFWACIQNFFITLRVIIFSFVTYICCAHHGNFCEWSDCDFFAANSVCKHSCFLLLLARISLTLFLKRWQRWENGHIASKRSITHAILGLF